MGFSFIGIMTSLGTRQWFIAVCEAGWEAGHRWDKSSAGRARDSAEAAGVQSSAAELWGLGSGSPAAAGLWGGWEPRCADRAGQEPTHRRPHRVRSGCSSPVWSYTGVEAETSRWALAAERRRCILTGTHRKLVWVSFSFCRQAGGVKSKEAIFCLAHLEHSDWRKQSSLAGTPLKSTAF